MDISPTLIPGLSASVSLFNTAYINGITGASLSNGTNTPALGLLTFYPAGATQAQIQAITGPYAVVNSFPSTIYYIDSVQQNNILNLDVEGLDVSGLYHFDTDSLGGFNLGGALTQFLLFNQHVKGGPTYTILNTTGANNTFPSVSGHYRLYAGWDFGSFSTKFTARYTPGYRNWSSSAINPVTVSPQGFPNGGGDIVKANVTFDLHASYTLDEVNALGVDMASSQVFVDVVNIFNKAPVFYNGANGFDQYSGNPIGRVVTVGVRGNF